jgi:penicillin-binding protein 1C
VFIPKEKLDQNILYFVSLS